MKTILNKRLQTLSAFIKEKETVLDIGCDHGLLGIYLKLNRDSIKVISSDINKGPLKKAKENIDKYNLTSEIETRLGDGLEVMTNDVTTIVISGMGGLNIINILKNIKEYPNVKKLVLSPNSDFKEMRYEVSNLGFKILKEDMVLEQGKFYLISEFVIGKEDIDYYFGKLDLENCVVKKYYQYIYDTNLDIINKLGNSDNIKKRKFIKENNYIKKNINIVCK